MGYLLQGKGRQDLEGESQLQGRGAGGLTPPEPWLPSVYGGGGLRGQDLGLPRGCLCADLCRIPPQEGLPRTQAQGSADRQVRVPCHAGQSHTQAGHVSTPDLGGQARVGNPGDKPRGFGCAGASVLGWVQLPSWEATSGGDPSAPVRLPGCRPGPRGPESLPRGRKNDLSHLCLTTPTPAWQQRGARMDRGESVVKAGTVTVRAQDGQGAGQGWEDVAAMGTEVGEWLDRVGAAPQSKSPPRCSKVPPGPAGRVLPCPPSRAARGWGSCLH